MFLLWLNERERTIRRGIQRIYDEYCCLTGERRLSNFEIGRTKCYLDHVSYRYSDPDITEAARKVVDRAKTEWEKRERKKGAEENARKEFEAKYKALNPRVKALCGNEFTFRSTACFVSLPKLGYVGWDEQLWYSYNQVDYIRFHSHLLELEEEYQKNVHSVANDPRHP